jgi:putative N6-adenine-specific DNA methylase
LAAALILLSSWRRKFPLYDPFCGSGTIVIEAGLYAWNLAPNLGRSFALSGLLAGSAEVEARVREALLSQGDWSYLVRVRGSDADCGVLQAARRNMERALALLGEKGLGGGAAAGTRMEGAGLPSPLEFAVQALEKAAPLANERGEKGFIITNPPYGRRLGSAEEAEQVYSAMGNLARRFPGWKLAVISDHPGFESFFGRRADSCREITSGAFLSYFYQFEAL